MHTGTKKAQTPCGYLEKKTSILMQKLYAALPHPGSAWFELRYLYSSARNDALENKECL
jgi:hypothetical protein